MLYKNSQSAKLRQEQRTLSSEATIMRQLLGRSTLLLPLSLVFAFFPCCAARGDLMFFSGNPAGFGHELRDEQTGHKHIMFNQPNMNLASLAAGEVEGYVAHSDFQRIWIASTEPLVASGGQAPGVHAVDGGFVNAMFMPHDENGNDFRVFRSLSMNIDMAQNAPTTAQINVYDISNALIGSHLFAVGHGNNFLGIIGLDGQKFARAEVVTAANMNRITQIRAGFDGLVFAEEDINVLATPEPLSWKLWLFVAVGVAIAVQVRCRVRAPSHRRLA